MRTPSTAGSMCDCMSALSFSSTVFAVKILEEKGEMFSPSGKIAIGILYQTEKPTLEENWPQLKNLMDKKTNWKDLRG